MSQAIRRPSCPWFRSFALAAAATMASNSGHAAVTTQLVASGLTNPVFATAPLNDGRVFIVEKGGSIKVSQGGVLSTFLTIPVATASEQGLLGLAFDPGYGTPSSAGFRRFFVNYSDPTTGDNVIASYRTSESNPLLANASTRVEVLRIDQPAGLTNHKGGWIGFKPGNPDNLYIATGDGGGSNDPFNNAQSRNTFLGKVLRVDISRDAFPSNPNLNYAVPLDNPFVGVSGTLPEIYALGLRNPWRGSFDRLSGDLWLGDVGQGAREEVDRILSSSAGGQNFGWRIREGNIATPGISDPAVAGLVDPVLDYTRGFGQSITGGYVVRDTTSELYGKYVFGDFVSGRIWAIDGGVTTATLAQAVDLTATLDAGGAGAIGNVASFGEGANGQLYIVDYGGKVVQVVPEPGTWAMMLAGALVVGWRLRRAASEARLPMPVPGA
jgi:glucose/arabinose dehydrogenase